MTTLAELIRARFPANIRRLSILQQPPHSSTRDAAHVELFHTLIRLWMEETKAQSFEMVSDAIHQAVNDHMAADRADRIARGEVAE